jgi:hypothetical protein
LVELGIPRKGIEMKRENRIFLVLAVIIVAGIWVLGVTTPDECKVPLDDMSSWCREVRFP